MRALVLANLSLLVLFPIAWTAPLMRAGILPLFGLSEISVVSGILALWQSDIVLAILVFFFAIIAPYAKTLVLSAYHFNLVDQCWLKPLHFLGRLAMADIFLIALYIVIAKGVGVGRLETAWGLYLFTACILASLVIVHLSERRDAR